MGNQGGRETRTIFAVRAVRVLVGLTVLQCFAALALGGEADTLTITGKVLLADGSPAAGAIIERQGINQHRTFTTHANADGYFQTSARFEDGINLHVRTTDGGQQAIYTLSAPSVRTAVRTPHEIKLRPATIHKISVAAAGKPVANADVIVTGDGFTASGKTDGVGQAEVRIPTGASLRSIAAHHPSSGVGGQYSFEGSVPKETYQVDLLPPAPHEIHVIDDNGRPVADFEFGVNVSVGDYEIIPVSALAATRVRTDKAGIAKVAWTPRDNLSGVTPEIWSNEWKTDALDSDHLKEGITTQKLRRKLPVAGRLVVPPGIDPTGILIRGMGWGTGNHIDLASARAAADGTFTLMVPSGHSYVIGILDTQWACDPWTGDLLTDRNSKQVQVELALYPATPLVVRVTRGSDHQPLAGASVELATKRNFRFTDDNGQRATAVGSLTSWLSTDADGIARGSAGRGEQKLSLRAGEWTEERTLHVKSADPIEVEFHRSWIGKRKVTGELVDAGKPFTPSPGATMMAWTASPLTHLQHAPGLLDQGKFELEFDEEHASLLFFDPKQKRSGSLEIGPQDSRITLQLHPTATYGGTLLDEAGRAIANQEVTLALKANSANVVASQRSDAAGKFHWDSVPIQTALEFRLRFRDDNPRYYMTSASAQRQFEPGEVREKDKPRVFEADDPPVTAPAKVPLAEAVAVICRDVRLNAMRALVVLDGDESDSIRSLAGRLLDAEDTPDAVAYRVLSMSPVRQKDEAAAIAERKWPKPEVGEVVFVVLDNTEAVVAHVRLKAEKCDAALSEGRQFLSVHRPAQRDALALLAAAQEEAKKSGRRIWVVSSGPRCRPCFMLARWMEDQHAMLERDYVLVKIMGGVDKNSEAVDSLLPDSESSGIPYYAIMEPDGKVLITSKGPGGNIAMPGAVEDIRHLKRMLEQTVKRLSAADIAALAESLAPK